MPPTRHHNQNPTSEPLQRNHQQNCNSYTKTQLRNAPRTASPPPKGNHQDTIPHLFKWTTSKRAFRAKKMAFVRDFLTFAGGQLQNEGFMQNFLHFEYTVKCSRVTWKASWLATYFHETTYLNGYWTCYLLPMITTSICPYLGSLFLKFFGLITHSNKNAPPSG